MFNRLLIVPRAAVVAALCLPVLAATAPTATMSGATTLGWKTAPVHRTLIMAARQAAPAGVGIVCAPQIANQRTGSFTVAWGTDGISTGTVAYGLAVDALNQSACDVRDTDPLCILTSSTHFVTLTQLLPDTTYFVQPVTGGAGGQILEVHTGPALDRPDTPATNAGKLYQSDQIQFGTGAYVCATLHDADGLGSQGASAPECDLISFDHQGFWSVDLAHARTGDLQGYFSYSTSGDQIEERACGGAEGCAEQTVDTGVGFISPTMYLGDTCGCDPGGCDDHNPCTDDSCDPDTHECTSTADDSNTCDDGNACTADACIAGACQSQGAPEEVCDGVDNDCDGSVDEDLPSTPTTCGVGACASTGSASCVDGRVVDSCTAGTPVAELCDGVDNDCDGSVDEDLGQTTCGEGACATTVSNCVDGVPQHCVVRTPSPETCDGIDNDCDGSIDEELGQTTCGVGACSVTVESCVGGVPQSCVPANPAPELCDGLDNDCDGAIDEGYVSSSTTCGVGACASTGTTSCVDGRVVDSCTAGSPTPEACDGVDNNCDGHVDEGACGGTLEQCLACPAGANGKVTICHHPGGNSSRRRTIQVGPSALDAHCRNHGDSCGPCAGDGDGHDDDHGDDHDHDEPSSANTSRGWGRGIGNTRVGGD